MPGTFTLASTANLNFELRQDSVTIGSNVNDLIIVNGGLTLDGTVNITEVGGSLADGSIYRLFNYTGTLVDNGLLIDATFLSNYPGASIDTSITNQVNLLVPEPSTWAMFMGGVAMLGVYQRARRRKG